MMMQDALEEPVRSALSDSPRRCYRGLVREEIVASWRESTLMGLRPDCLEPAYDGDGLADCVLAAEPVVERLAADLAGTDISVVLSDDRMRIVARRVPREEEVRRLDSIALAPGYIWSLKSAGTNAIGVASAEHVPAIVDGQEHFMQALTEVTAACAPVMDRRKGQLIGAVTLVCPVRSASPLLLPVVRHAAREIEQRLRDGSSTRQRFLDDQFMRARRRTRGPLALVGTDTLLMNAAAARVLTVSDQPRLWAEARASLRAGRRTTTPLSANDGSRLVANVEPVREGGVVAGVLLHFRRPDAAPRPPVAQRPSIGWGSLTETELCLAELIADGLTNKEAAARLFVSHHTIDSHLRHIFSKLDINSRVELARVFAARVASSPDHAVA